VAAEHDGNQGNANESRGAFGKGFIILTEAAGGRKPAKVRFTTQRLGIGTKLGLGSEYHDLRQNGTVGFAPRPQGATIGTIPPNQAALFTKGGVSPVSARGSVPMFHRVAIPEGM